MLRPLLTELTHDRGQDKVCWQLQCGHWSLIVVGIGSFLFHGTMRYHAELLDELPMLLLMSCGILQNVGSHPWAPSGTEKRWVCGTLLTLSVLSGAYVATRVFVYFLTGFTLCTFVLFGWALALKPCPTVKYLAKRAAIVMTSAGLVWLLENNLCPILPWVWPLHNLWHLLSCLAANDMFAAGFYDRVAKHGARGVVAKGVGQLSRPVALLDPFLCTPGCMPASLPTLQELASKAC